MQVAMNQNRPGRPSNDPQTVDEETLNAVESHVEYCLTHQEGLSRVLEELEAEKLRGEEVQEDLNDLFRRESALAVIASLDRHDRLDGALDDLEACRDFTADEIERFETWWNRVDWIVAGLPAFNHAQAGEPHHWTDKEIDLDGTSGELVVEHVLSHGVDEIHRLRIPADKLFLDSVQRLQVVMAALPTAVKKGDIDAESAKQILECREDLESILEALDEFGEMTESILEELSPEDAPEGEESSTDLAALFDATRENGTSSEEDQEQAMSGFR